MYIYMYVYVYLYVYVYTNTTSGPTKPLAASLARTHTKKKCIFVKAGFLFLWNEEFVLQACVGVAIAPQVLQPPESRSGGGGPLFVLLLCL